MSIRSVSTLAMTRRAPRAGGAAAAAPAPDPKALGALESAIPAEVITLYTAIIAGCQAVVTQTQTNTYLPFRLTVYLVGVVTTAFTTGRAVRSQTAGASEAVRSAELFAALVAFIAWGAVLPGSFLYAWLTGSRLSLTVVTVTAGATFILAVLAAPKLRQPVAVKPRQAATPTASVLPPTRTTPPS
jgi:hypothetical protein